MRKNLFLEIGNNEEKLLYYRSRIYRLSLIKKKIERLKNKLSKKKIGIVSISTKNKINFIINFYACNQLGFPVFLNNNNSVKEILKEKIKVNYIFRNDKIFDVTKIYNQKYKYDIIIKTSGSTSLSKYVLLKNETLSFVCSNMNKEMFDKNSMFNELIFAPIDHAFGFARLHSLIVSRNNFTMTDNISYSKLDELTINIKNINSLSIPAKILTNLLNMNQNISKQILKNIRYIQVSTGYFPLKLRKRLVSLNINLFINYGMTEAMRATFLNYNKFKNKIKTEGRPFEGVKIKILKKKGAKFGKILIKGKNLANGYSDKKEWNKKFKSDYFDSGDIGSLDSDNFLTYKTRDSNKLNINGITLYLDKIENIIKDKFMIPAVKIINFKNVGLYLFIDKDIDNNLIHTFLKKTNINIVFNKIMFLKFNKKDTGKINLTNIIKKISEKKY